MIPNISKEIYGNFNISTNAIYLPIDNLFGPKTQKKNTEEANNKIVEL